MTISIALRELLAAQSAHDVAKAGYDGGAWWIHGDELIVALNKAQEEFDAALSYYIDERISQFHKGRE